MLTIKSMFQSEDLDEKSLDFLVQALESNNLPGFDYLEFKRAVLQLQEINLDEPTAYKSAVTTAATLGITKEKLLETAGFIILMPHWYPIYSELFLPYLVLSIAMLSG